MSAVLRTHVIAAIMTTAGLLSTLYVVATAEPRPLPPVELLCA